MRGVQDRASFWADHYYDDEPPCCGGDCYDCPAAQGCLEVNVKECPGAYACGDCAVYDGCEDPGREPKNEE